MRVNEVLDFLYDLGCSNDIPDDQMKTLCTLLGVAWADLQKHTK